MLESLKVLPLHSHLSGAVPAKLIVAGLWQVRQSLKVIPLQLPQVSWHSRQTDPEVKKNSLGLVQVQVPIGVGARVILAASLHSVQWAGSGPVQAPQVLSQGRQRP